jgi:hypothetical protein
MRGKRLQHEEALWRDTHTQGAQPPRQRLGIGRAVRKVALHMVT